MMFDLLSTRPTNVSGAPRLLAAPDAAAERLRQSVNAPSDTFSMLPIRNAPAAELYRAKRAARAFGQTPRLGIKKLLQWSAVGCLVGSVQGYACTGYDPSANQYFQLAERNVTGLIHGWFSDCYDYSYLCGQSCTTTTSSTGSSSTSCSPRYCFATASDQTPQYYVAQMASLVEGCGFNLVATANLSPPQRVANALLERNHRVKISVNQFNTSGTTDSAVACLHNLT